MANKAMCGTHGEREARYVCDHLFVNSRAAEPDCMLYFVPELEEGEPTPMIWCEACEVVILAEGEVNRRADEFAKFHLVCDFCFASYLTANTPAPMA